MRENNLNLLGKNQAIVFEKNDGRFSFSFWVKEKEKWRKATADQSSLIWGKNFDLYPQKIVKPNRKTLLLFGQKKAQDLNKKSFIYSWEAKISLDRERWFKFEVEVDSPRPIYLYQEEGEPRVSIKLVTVPVQHEGGFIWNQVLIPNPATDFQGIQGSDLPATYFFDPQTKTEMMFYLDWESLNWTSSKNIFGFLGGHCGLKTILKKGGDQPFRQRFLGFWPEKTDYLGNIFPKGKSRFCFYFFLNPISHQPDEWEGLTRLIGEVSPFLKSEGQVPGENYSWEGFGQKCLKELITKPEVAQIKFKEGLGLRAYGQIRDFGSPNPAKRVELMTQADILWPLTFYLRLHPDKQIEGFYRDLFSLLPHFFDKKNSFLANWYPLEKVLKHQDEESWYFLENGLIKLGWIALLTKNSSLKEIFLKFCRRIIEIGQDSAYLFPLKYDWRENKNVGGRKNFIAAGLYSYGMCLAFFLTGQKEFLNEASFSLRAIHQLPLELLFHEPQQLGFAAAASLFLNQETGEEKYLKWSREFIAQQLRMFYWYTDKTVKEAINCDCAGMVRSFPSKIYPVVKQNPAFKENVESVLPWLPLLKEKTLIQPLLKFLNLVRLNNFYFFDLFQGVKEKDASFVPLEALPALPESGQRHQGGGVGHAVYGAGEVLWLYLLFESLARASDPRIMCLCLDFLDFSFVQNDGWGKSFLLYNPTFETISFEFIDKKLKNKKSLTLDAQAFQYVSI